MDTIYKRLESKDILVVDDDPSTLKWLVRVLSLYFNNVYKASDVPEALKVFKNNPTHIVIADIQMPDIDGLSFLQKIKSLQSDTFRIIMTAFNSPDYLNRAVESGVHLYLKKPIDIDELLVAISSYIVGEVNNEDCIELGESFLFYDSKQMVFKNDKAIILTKKELLLLQLLLKNKLSFVSLELIEQIVWQEDTTPDAIRMVIVGLRKKLHSKLIENLKGLGYRINLP